jgi:hypothetical protein
MTDLPDSAIREKIAAEAARLLYRGKEPDFHSARKRAARHWKHLRLRREHMPSQAEIQVQLQILGGVFDHERDAGTRLQMQLAARDLLLQFVAASPPAPPDSHSPNLTQFDAGWSVSGPAVDGPVSYGASIELHVPKSHYAAISIGLKQRGVSVTHTGERFQFFEHFPCAVYSTPAAASVPQLTLEELIAVIADHAGRPDVDELPVDPGAEARALYRLLLEPLAGIEQDPYFHPEGDALYHSLQVFERGRDLHPWDEEFLAACLLHDVGLAISPRHPIPAAIYALGDCISARTRFLIEQRPLASDYLLTGELPRSLRRHEDFEELVDLARCDRDGRVRGARVPTLDQALDVLAELGELCRDEDESGEEPTDG